MVRAHKSRPKFAQDVQNVFTEDWVRQGDLYEVFSVLDALAVYDQTLVQGARLARAIQRLIACEQRPGGPYQTGAGHVDVAANVAIARFLAHLDVVLPRLQQYLDDSGVDVATYPRIDVAALSPAAQGLLEQVQALQGRPDHDVATVAPSTEDPLAGAGAILLQTAILEQAKRRMQALPSPLRETGVQVWDEMRRADRNHEIVLMPQMFASTLKDASTVERDQLQLLGAANFFCWIATILYDDFIDEEGDPARLPIANVAYRASLDLYRQALAARPDLYSYVEHMYDTVDRANAWEVASTRASITPRGLDLATLPDYGDRMVLADRAFGHTIGPMLLVQQVPGVRQAQVRHVQTALKHYLIARQLNDDIHDWRKDLGVGQLSTAVVELLCGAGVGAGTHRLKTLVPRLEEYFFRDGLAKLCEQLIGHAALCRQELAASKLTRSDGGFLRLVDDLEVSARAAMGVQDDRQEFLATYQTLVS